MRTNPTKVCNRLKSVAFIAARLDSSRLPAKQFRNIGEKPIIELVTTTLRSCREIDEIVIATVADPVNEPLKHFAERNGLSCFWYEGEVNHLTTRLRKAAEIFKADICVLISCDSPLIYSPAIDYLVKKLKETPEADHISASINDKGMKCALEGVSVARRSTWQRADDLSDKPELKEHMFPVISRRPDLFKKDECPVPMDIYFKPHRFSVDTWADLVFLNRIYQTLNQRNKEFELPEVLRLLREQPQLLEINSHVHQRVVGEVIRPILYVVDTDNKFGNKHFSRCLDLALQITERLSWPVTFMVDCVHASNILEKHGFRVIRNSSHTNSDIFQSPPLLRLISEFSVLIIDIYRKFILNEGWRRKITADTKVIIFNQTESWCKEADQVIFTSNFAPDSEDDKTITGLENGILQRPFPAEPKKSEASINETKIIVQKIELLAKTDY